MAKNMHTITTILKGGAGLAGVEAVEAIPSVDQITEIAKLLVQIAVGIVTVWSLIKKKKPQQ